MELDVEQESGKSYLNEFVAVKTQNERIDAYYKEKLADLKSHLMESHKKSRRQYREELAAMRGQLRKLHKKSNCQFHRSLIRKLQKENRDLRSGVKFLNRSFSAALKLAGLRKARNAS